MPIILDVDTGIDDAMALLYACASPEVELVAVTCVSGNVEARQVAENTRAVLELAGRADVEVALGREVPLVRPLMTSPETHGPRGIGYATLPSPSRPVSPRHAADLIADEARRRPGEITLVAVGPQTNVAVALQREPALPQLLRRFVSMGGAFRAAGNTTPVSEWNIAVDPDAAKVVADAFGTEAFRASGRPLPLALGLDVTEQAILRPADLDLLYARAGGTPFEPGPALHRRRAALLLRIPRALRRLPWRPHARSAGAGRGAGPVPGHDRAGDRGRGADRGPHRRADGRRLAPPLGPRPEHGRGRDRPG